MSDFMFYLFAAMAVVSSLLVVTSRNPVNAAMFLIVAFVASAALFALLEAFFLAIIQVLVYAGAVVVLFLFIIMLLNIDKTRRLRPDTITVMASVTALALMVTGVIMLFAQGGAGEMVQQTEVAAPAAIARNFGYEMFTTYLLPFQVTGFLLLIAMIGVIHISRRDSRSAGPKPANGEQA